MANNKFPMNHYLYVAIWSEIQLIVYLITNDLAKHKNRDTLPIIVCMMMMVASRLLR